MKKREKVQWGAGAAPSIKRVDPLRFCKSILLSVPPVAFIGTWAAWRPLPSLPMPPGSFVDHLSYGGAWVMHQFAPSFFSHKAQLFAAHIEALKNHGEIGGIYARLAMGAAAGLVPLGWAAWKYLRPRDGLIYLRGARRYSGKVAVDKLKAKLSPAVKRQPDHAIAPDIFYPKNLWTRHMLVVAGTGAGKSTVLRPLVQTIVKHDEQMLLFDPKGEFTRAFEKPILIAPWDERGWAWDIGGDMRNIGFARRFAAALILQGTDPMWANAARQLVVGSLLYLQRKYGIYWGWRQIADTLALPQPSLLKIMSRHFPEAVRAVERASVTTQGVLINLTAFCSPIFDLADAWGDTPADRRVSFFDWIKNPELAPRQIILQGNGAYPEITKGYVEGIFSVISGMVSSVELEDSPDRKVWIICEELPQMGKIPIRPLFELGRSRGLRCIAVCQDLAQLEEVHGAQTVKSLVSMSGSILIGQVSQGDTAETLAKALGAREVERRNISTSFGSGRSQSVSYARETIPLYTAAELGSRLGYDEDRKGVRFALALEGNIYELFWPTFPMKDARAAHIPSAWANGLVTPIGHHPMDNDDNSDHPDPVVAFAPSTTSTPHSDEPLWLDDGQAIPLDDASSSDDFSPFSQMWDGAVSSDKSFAEDASEQEQ
ncbi:Type IV secretory pathway, VirD4 component, TraG/TraD family ATPase [Duganella sacchari]|uniref:Type IV secretory pathway, VirD4 component, TraG/TraD family ATPase n=1 Tax=Duganella sacchari TaxID=551987 RepID=A0A1M7R598_9BURK|nr:type IV secretion system DNA-binding domain-containing protein [Duganella sacchari]SHN40529.1 Type IV secretory pathway, VirD4 component, TraG/TraD family ATPase [Duganella sacchari]